MEAPADLPAVILLNFRDKMEEDAAAKASQKPSKKVSPPVESGTPLPTSTSPQISPKSPPPNPLNEGTPGVPPQNPCIEEGAGEEATVEADGAESGGGGGGEDGAWGHVATLEDCRLMMDRVKEADEAEGKGGRRRVSLFDCSMKNCFGLRVRNGARGRGPGWNGAGETGEVQ